MISNEECVHHILSTSPAHDTFDWINYSNSYIPSCKLRHTPLTIQLTSLEEIVTSSTGSSSNDSENTSTWQINNNKQRRVEFQLIHCNSSLSPPIQSTIAIPENTTLCNCETNDNSNNNNTVTCIPNMYIYNETITFPLCIANVFLDTLVLCRVLNSANKPIASSSFHLFNVAGLLKTGMHVYPLYEVTHNNNNNKNNKLKMSIVSHTSPSNDELLLRELDQGRLQSIPWLDPITYKYITEQTIDRQWKTYTELKESKQCNCKCGNKSIIGYVRVTFPLVKECACPVIFRDATSLFLETTVRHDNSKDNNVENKNRFTSSSLSLSSSSIITPYVDYDYMTAKSDNLCENYATVLSKALLFSSLDETSNVYENRRSRFMCYEPGVQERYQLSAIANRAPLFGEKLRVEEIELLWRHRLYLIRDTRLCIPFLKCVDWTNAAERMAASEVISQWHHLPLADTLACLSSLFDHIDEVHTLAVRQLREESDEQLCWIVPQLVQALRFTSIYTNSNKNNTLKEKETKTSRNGSEGAFQSNQCLDDNCKVQNSAVNVVDVDVVRLSEFLINKALHHWEFCCTLYWTVLVEAQLEKAANESTEATPTSSPTNTIVVKSINTENNNQSENDGGAVNCKNAERMFIFRNFCVELESALVHSAPLFVHRLQQQRRLYNSLKLLRSKVKRGNPERHRQIERGRKLLSEKACGLQQLFSDSANKINTTITTTITTSENINNNIVNVISHNETGTSSSIETTNVTGDSTISVNNLTYSSLSVPTTSFCFLSAKERRSVTLPTHPNLFVRGFVASRFFVFKSSKMPLRLPFWVSNQLNDKEDDFNDEDVYALTPKLSESAEHHTISNTNDYTSDMKKNNNNSNSSRHTSNTNCKSVFTSVVTQEYDKNNNNNKLSSGGTCCTNDKNELFEAALMFKTHDDVRQDQLVLQLIHVMDVLCKRDGLELYLTPYRVLATGPHDGLVELIPHVVTLQSVQRDVFRYLRQYNETESEIHNAMARYTRSFAGYSVFSFVMGIGDRHLENILLARDGRLLHVDFGYILGHDPKPFPPPMKISREMVEVLGGPQSVQYTEFKSYCCSAYNILRKNASLFLNLLLLMNHAIGLPQLTGAQSINNTNNTTINNNMAQSLWFMQLMKVQQRLRLDLTNAQATQYLQNVIADSVGSLFANLWDALHAAAQATRT